MKLVRLIVLVGALCLAALPASAAVAGSSAGVQHATKKSRSAHAPGARARKRVVTPHEACSGLGLSHKREPGQARSPFNACVVAAAHGAEEGEEGEGEGA